MNDQQLDNKVRQDAAKVKKDLNTLMEHGTARISRLGDSLSQSTVKAKEDLTTWAEDGVTQLSAGVGKLADEARETVIATAATVKKDVGQGLVHYNKKAQEVANRVPGSFAKQATKYPWVSISIALALGLLLGIVLKPSHQSIG
jgi:ElaB/YqjD/DUF883 family membrane-anchored ribosome-binding protein